MRECFDTMDHPTAQVLLTRVLVKKVNLNLNLKIK